MWGDSLIVTAMDVHESSPTFDEEWQKLWERCPNATIFQSPEWIHGCHSRFARGDPRITLVARSGNELVAIATLRYYGDILGFEGLEVSDYCDFLVLPEWRHLVTSKFVEHLVRERGLLCEFERLENTSPLLEPTLPNGLTARTQAHDVCPFLPLASGATELEQVVPSGFCKRVRQAQRVARRQFRVDFITATSTSVASHLQRLYALHGSRWSERGESGVFSNPAAREFYLQIAPQSFERGRLWLFELTFDATPIAALLAFFGHGRVLYYIAGFAPEYARYSPGRLVVAELIERGLAARAREVDFLRGVEPYKYDWGARNRSTHRVAFARNAAVLDRKDNIRLRA